MLPARTREALETQNKWPWFRQPPEDEGFAGTTAPRTQGMTQGVALGSEGNAASWEEKRG